MRLLWGVLIGAFVGIGAATAQAGSDDNVIDTLLSQPAVTWENAAWLVGRAVGTFDDAVTPRQAAEKAVNSGWGDKTLAPEARLDLAGYSQLLVRALNIPTGLLYNVFPYPRYAYRELVFRKVIPGSLAPDDRVSGEEAMRYLQYAQSWKESHQ